MWGEIKDRLKSGEPKKIALATYSKVPPPSAKNQIAIVVGQGDIVRGNPGDDARRRNHPDLLRFNHLLKLVEKRQHDQGRSGADRFARGGGHGQR
jgi:hypothetical protein